MFKWLVKLFNITNKPEVKPVNGDDVLRDDRIYQATRYAFCFVGDWYKWGGSNPDGFDCSGFVCEILTAVGILPRKTDLTAQALFDRYKNNAVSEAKEGCLVIYANESTPDAYIHVEYCINGLLSIGASGGGSQTLTIADAIKNNAFIKVRPIGVAGRVYKIVDPFGRG
jgi:cell wall-associated NlpC family hydrolase